MHMSIVLNEKSKFSAIKLCESLDLPHPSFSLMNILHLLHEPNMRLDNLVDAIKQDQVLVGQMLRQVNSSYYCLMNPVTSVKQAVTLLGTINIKHLVYSGICFDYFDKFSQEEWNHSYTTSLLITELIKNNYIPDHPHLQLIALLHDIGKVAMRNLFTSSYNMLIDEAMIEHKEFCQKEREMFGFDHADLGGWLLDAWKLPDSIIKPIKYHHFETLPMAYRLETSILKIADWVDHTARGHAHPIPPFDGIKSVSNFETEKKFLVSSQKELIKSVESINFQDN